MSLRHFAERAWRCGHAGLRVSVGLWSCQSLLSAVPWHMLTMQADNAPQRVSKIPIEAVLLLSPPRSLPPVPFAPRFTVQGSWNVTQDPALLCRCVETFSERSGTTPNPQASCRGDGRDGMTLHFQGGAQWLSPLPTEQGRGSIRHRDPESKPKMVTGHESKWARGGGALSSWRSHSLLFSSFITFGRLRPLEPRTWSGLSSITSPP